jgi:hypothetical protein
VEAVDFGLVCIETKKGGTPMSLTDDLLAGAGAIAKYVYGKNDKKHRRKVYYKFERQEWPLWKDGQEITSRKSLLDQYFTPKAKVA